MMHGGFGRKIVTWAIGIMLVMYVVNSPEQAGSTAREMFSFLERAGAAIGTFTASL